MQGIQHGLKTLEDREWSLKSAIAGIREQLQAQEKMVDRSKAELKQAEESLIGVRRTIVFLQRSQNDEKPDVSDEDADQLTLHFGGSDPIRDLARAIVKTREYVHPTRLPAIEGWDWYDALKKHAPDILQEILDAEHNAQIREENREKMEVELNADMQEDNGE